MTNSHPVIKRRDGRVFQAVEILAEAERLFTCAGMESRCSEGTSPSRLVDIWRAGELPGDNGEVAGMGSRRNHCARARYAAGIR
jgi:hypothetical protein